MAWDSFSAVLSDILMKLGMFVLVQALLYLIISNSSNIFQIARSLSIRTPRSVSFQRVLAALSDLPAGSVPSPPSAKSPGWKTFPSNLKE